MMAAKMEHGGKQITSTDLHICSYMYNYIYLPTNIKALYYTSMIRNQYFKKNIKKLSQTQDFVYINFLGFQAWVFEQIQNVFLITHKNSTRFR